MREVSPARQFSQSQHVHRCTSMNWWTYAGQGLYQENIIQCHKVRLHFPLSDDKKNWWVGEITWIVWKLCFLWGDCYQSVIWLNNTAIPGHKLN
jgi:hypothetical protein